MKPTRVFDDRITTGDAAKILHCTPQWVRTLILMEDIDAILTPLGYLINPASVHNYAKRRHVNQTTTPHTQQ